MLKSFTYFICIIIISSTLSLVCVFPPMISNLTYDNITQIGITLYWTTDQPADSKVKWFVSDSNYQPVIFTDSIYNSTLVTSHSVQISNLQTAKIYKYQVTSQNSNGTAFDSGYFITQSLSSGWTEVYHNHSVDTNVSTGEKAKGNQNFTNILKNRIDSTQYSIDITLWEYSDDTASCNALIRAKNRGVKIRFIYNHFPNTPILDSLQTHGIPIIKRFSDTTYDMHNKFWVFDYRYNSNPNKKILWTGSTNVSHPQFHSDRNNIIIIQDESLAAVYTREFEEMWGSHTDFPDLSRAKFGPSKINNVPHILNVSGTRMEVYFSPSDSVASFLCNVINTKTTKSVFFCILKYENLFVENSMHNIFNNGKQIKGVFDSSHSAESHSVYPRMKGLPVPNSWNPPANVFLDTISGLIHHKYFIIDANSNSGTGNKIIATGSYNWETAAALNNDDNSLTIFSPRVNNLYYQEFYSRYRESGGEMIGIKKISSQFPSEYRLEQNYPNPFNSMTNIRFYIHTGFPLRTRWNDKVKLKVYDILGKEVATLVNEKLDAGSYEVKFDASGLPSGIYYYRMETDNFADTKKMIILK